MAVVLLVLVSLGGSMGWAWLKKNHRPLTGHWAGRAARFFYGVGLPYLAVVGGLLTTRLLGLKGLEYFGLVNPAQPGAQIRQATVLMLLEWLVDIRAALLAGGVALVILAALLLSLRRHGLRPEAVPALSGVDTVYDALHWAFYRAALWSITGQLYLGVVLGAGLVILEWLAGAWLAGEWPRQRWLNMMVLVLTAAVFFYSPNLWLLWPLHLAMVLLCRVVLGAAPRS